LYRATKGTRVDDLMVGLDAEIIAEPGIAMSFKDHFSDASSAYRNYRPGYPPELFAYLADIAPSLHSAWDCATGSGQAACRLAQHFRRVTATDASENQIQNAQPHPNVLYKVEKAEKTSFADQSLDLITVAQALHWFSLPEFSREVQRVLKPGGILAVWTYGLSRITPAIDAIVNQLYGPTLEPYWPEERTQVERGYAEATFPLKQIAAPEFKMQSLWTANQLLNYLRTWSAVKRFEEANKHNPVTEIADSVNKLWDTKVQLVSWPLTVKIWST